MSHVAREARTSRERLYKALSGDRSPDFDTIIQVLGAPDLELHAEPAYAALRQESAPFHSERAPRKLPPRCGGCVNRARAIAAS